MTTKTSRPELKGDDMFLARLPLDYLQHIDPGDRVRRSRTRPNGNRVRRNAPGGTGE